MRKPFSASPSLVLHVLLAISLLSFSSAASAYSLRIEARNPQETYASSDTVTVDVFLQALDGPGLTFLSVAVLSTAVALQYDIVASADNSLITYPAPPVASGTTGGQPGYILYAPAAGTSAAVALYPQQGPAFATFPSSNAGIQHININYAVPSFGTTFATGRNIWIATLVYHIADSGVIQLSFEDSNIVSSGELNFTDQVALSGQINITVPEPSTVFLIGLGLLGLGHAGRRRRYTN